MFALTDTVCDESPTIHVTNLGQQQEPFVKPLADELGIRLTN